MGTVLERVILPDDGWADVRDPKKVPERLRRPVRQAAIALQRTLPEDQRKPSVHVSEPDEVASDETQAAFGTPPVDALVEEAKEDEDAPLVLPTDEQQEAMDAYNESLLLAVVTAWSYSDSVTIESIRDIPGDAYDALIVRIRQLNQGTEEKTDSLAADPFVP